MFAGGRGITINGVYTGREAILLALADIGFFRRRIMRSLYAMAARGVIWRDDIEVWFIIGQRPPVRILSVDGDY